MAYLLIGDSGTVQLSGDGIITSESASYTAKVTSNPMEGGGQINDHATTEPIRFDVSGTVVGGAARTTLEAMWRNRDLISYRGIEALDNLLITSLSISRSVNNRDGYEFKVSFTQVQIASAAFVPLTGPTITNLDADAEPAASAKKSAKKKTEDGLKVAANDYMNYSASFYGPTSTAPTVRTNPSYNGVSKE